MLQTVSVALRDKLVAVAKSEGGSPASICVGASTVFAYPEQSYNIKFISVTNYQLGKLMFRYALFLPFFLTHYSKITVTVHVLLGLQSPCHQEDSPPALISSAIFRFNSLSTLRLRFL